jgi:hypothetical protein
MCCHLIFVVRGGKTLLRLAEECYDNMEKTINAREGAPMVGERFQSSRTASLTPLDRQFWFKRTDGLLSLM